MNSTDPIIANFQYSLNYLRDLVDELTERQWVAQSPHIKNHAAWVLGHLAFSCQAIGGEIGIERWLADDWGERYGMGSVPSQDITAYESKAELLECLGDAENRICKAVRSLSQEQLAQPLPDRNYQQDLPTTHHAISQILIAHTAYHVGQTVIWRREIGLPPVERPFL